MDALLNLTGDRVDGRQVAFEALSGLAEAAVPSPLLIGERLYVEDRDNFN
jgi:hypothetical protein